MRVENIYQIIDGCDAKGRLFVVVESDGLGDGLASPDGLHLGLGVLGDVDLDAIVVKPFYFFADYK
jgi:hypothetical protein